MSPRASKARRKAFGVPIIVGEKTALAAPSLAFLEIASVRVRGKERPERIFALIGDETVEQSNDFAKLERRACAACLRRSPRAMRRPPSPRSTECRELGGRPLAQLYANYERQLSERAPATLGA